MKIPTYFNNYFDKLDFEPNLRSFIVTEMTAPHRHYHTLAHLAQMLKYIYYSGVRATPGNPVMTFEREVVAATLFHDIVYDARETDNEEQSVATALLWLDADKHDLDLQLVADLIIATKSHDSDYDGYAGSRLRRTFINADLSILWADQHVYEWYAKGIRKEYAHVPNEAYREGRAAVLKRLVNGMPSYYNRDATQRNVDWELANLQQGLFDVP